MHKRGGGELCYQIKQTIKTHKILYWFDQPLAYVQFSNSSLGSTKIRFYKQVSPENLYSDEVTLSNTPPYYL